MRRMYSENQIKNIVADAPEQVVEALENQDVKVKTIEQSEANLELTPSSMSAGGGLAELGLTKHERFVRVQQINAELHIIINIAMENKTGSSVTLPVGAQLYGYVVIPETIASKIYDESGLNFTETAISGKDKVSITPTIINDGNSTKQGKLVVWHNTVNQMYFSITLNESLALANDNQAYFSGRVQLSLL